MPSIASQVQILPPQVHQELTEKLKGEKSPAGVANVELGNQMHTISVVETSCDAKHVGEGRKSFLSSVKDFFNSVRDAFINFFSKASEPTKGSIEIAAAPVMDKHAAVVAQNKEIMGIFLQNHDFLKTEGIMRISAAKTELDLLSAGKKDLQDATGVELAALFKKNIREHCSPADMKAFEQTFLDYQNNNQLPLVSDLPEMAQDAIMLAKEVAKYQGENHMTASNLAIVMAPNLMSTELLMQGKTLEFNTFFEKLIQQA
ncbi:hypothetical protein ATO46_11430 [Aeromonas schubertii]|uniref:RhoGAP domain-containing protein n=2 Tax=Aeromonas TaxID=642 RepID=UPI00067F433F|nr:RhoGAP domain-containing protein [Aeromonas schubertii]KUE78293.1 hypothetical protein ATO46_11430 [Aeromonas schubertii]